MIYFVVAPELGRTKIGFATDPWKRFSKLQSDSPCRLELVALQPGDCSTEADLHDRFSQSRLHGEWFASSAPLQAHIETLPRAVRPRRETPVGDLVAAVGISQTYASMILSGKRRPCRPLAIVIFRKTGWKHESIERLTERQMRILEEIEPWEPRAAQAIAA